MLILSQEDRWVQGFEEGEWTFFDGSAPCLEIYRVVGLD
jgi:hypothetical protein